MVLELKLKQWAEAKAPQGMRWNEIIQYKNSIYNKTKDEITILKER
jgi:hypothetical protein